MGDSSFLRQGKSNCEWSGEADHRERDVAFGKIAAKLTGPHGAGNDSLKERLSSSAEVGPVGFFQERMKHVDHPKAAIQGGMHILAQRLGCVWNLFQQSLSGVDGRFQR